MDDHSQSGDDAHDASKNANNAAGENHGCYDAIGAYVSGDGDDDVPAIVAGLSSKPMMTIVLAQKSTLQAKGSVYHGSLRRSGSATFYCDVA